MLTALSTNLMIFVDRLILARYSTEAMNAAASIGMVSVVFIFGAIGIASIAEVFVGQYNGSKQKLKMGIPAWQMLWFSLMTYPIFLAALVYLDKIFIPEHLYQVGFPYFQWLMIFGPIPSMIAALSAFFIGHGKSRIIFLITLLGNVTNLILDIILVFGIEGFIPSLGTEGAALATVFSQVLQLIILFAFFLSPHNRKTYGTFNWIFRLKEFWKCLKIGTPNALGHMIEFSAWAYIMHEVAKVSEADITVLVIAQSIFIVFAFLSDGMQKGVIAVAANLIGGKKTDLVSKMVRSGMNLQLIMAVVLAIPLIIYPDPFIRAFLPEEVSFMDQGQLIIYCKLALIGVLLFFIFDGFTWIMAGVLTAGGDTMFNMYMNATSAWVFGIVPTYLLIINKPHSNPSLTWAVNVIYAVLNFIVFYLRYRTHKWKSKQVIEHAQEIVKA